MANKHQKRVKQEALKRRAGEEAILARYGLLLDDEPMAVGIVLEQPSVSQVAYFAIKQINDFCRACVGLDVALFCQTTMRPCLVPICPLFDAPRMSNWTDPLVATSTSTCLESLATRAPLVVHYVWWPDFIDRRDLSQGELARAFRDPRVIVVVRGEGYRELVEAEFNIKVQGGPIPHFDLDKLFKIMLPLMRGSNV